MVCILEFLRRIPDIDASEDHHLQFLRNGPPADVLSEDSLLSVREKIRQPDFRG